MNLKETVLLENRLHLIEGEGIDFPELQLEWFRRTFSSPLDYIYLVGVNDIYTAGNDSVQEDIDNSVVELFHVDRGGGITYQGRGQLNVVCLFNIQRLDWSPPKYLAHIKSALMDTIRTFLPNEYSVRYKKELPGLYVYKGGTELGKICNIGLSFKGAYVYHGFSLNYDVDLSMYSKINPCGQKNPLVVNLIDFNKHLTLDDFKKRLVSNLRERYLGNKQVFVEKTEEPVIVFPGL